jgi:rare lipoprotein A
MSTKGDGVSDHGARHRADDTDVESRTPWLTRPRVVVAAGAVVLAVVTGVTAVSLGLGPDPGPTTTGATATDTARDDDERAARNNMRDTGTISPSPATPSAASSAPGRTPSRPPKASTSTGTSGTGTCGVSFYSTGSTTANGERFDPDGLTAAHKTLPFNTRIRVTNPANGKSVVVRVNDRGPFVGGRCLDLARGAFAQIASLGSGVINARYEVLK